MPLTNKGVGNVVTPAPLVVVVLSKVLTVLLAVTVIAAGCTVTLPKLGLTTV